MAMEGLAPWTCAYREADDDASGEDEGPPPAKLRRAPVAVVADDGLHLPAESVSALIQSRDQRTSSKITARTKNGSLGHFILLVILSIFILSYPFRNILR